MYLSQNCFVYYCKKTSLRHRNKQNRKDISSRVTARRPASPPALSLCANFNTTKTTRRTKKTITPQIKSRDSKGRARRLNRENGWRGWGGLTGPGGGASRYIERGPSAHRIVIRGLSYSSDHLPSTPNHLNPWINAHILLLDRSNSNKSYHTFIKPNATGGCQFSQAHDDITCSKKRESACIVSFLAVLQNRDDRGFPGACTFSLSWFRVSPSRPCVLRFETSNDDDDG